DPSTKLLRSNDGQCQASWPSPGNSVVRSVALCPDESMAAIGTEVGQVRLYLVPSGKILADLAGHADRIESIAFSKDGQLLATGSRDQTVRLWQRGDSVYRHVVTLRSPGGAVVAVRFHPDDSKLAMLVQNERGVRLWHLDKLRRELAHMGIDW